MASSDNLASLEPWLFRFAFSSNPWFSDADILTKSAPAPAGSGAGISPSDGSSLYDIPSDFVSPSPTPNTPFGSGSDPDPETAASKRAGPGPASAGRVGKRKPRPPKKNPTTYITADAANFRQMVQQVTGVRFPEAAQIPSAAAHVLKPKPQRIAGAGFGGRILGRLPTLDTSAFLFGSAGASVAEIGCDGGGVAGLGFDDVSCFPTLDSWKAL